MTQPLNFRDVHHCLSLIHCAEFAQMSLTEDWKLLGEKLGYTNNQLTIFQFAAPFEHSMINLLKDWKLRPNSTVDVLIKALKEMDREDARREVIKYASVTRPEYDSYY